VPFSLVDRRSNRLILVVDEIKQAYFRFSIIVVRRHCHSRSNGQDGKEEDGKIGEEN
jgi:hypothetical protein